MLRHGAVDASIDPREARRDLVHRPVEVVDPALQRDREVEQVARAAAEERPPAPLRTRETRIQSASARSNAIAATAPAAIATASDALTA